MLSQRQQRALLGLLEQPSKAAAAQAAGISPRALRSYLADPAFTAELQRLQDEQIADAAQRGRQSMTAAMSTLRAIADDKSANAQNRIMACRSLLEYEPFPEKRTQKAKKKWNDSRGIRYRRLCNGEEKFILKTRGRNPTQSRVRADGVIEHFQIGKDIALRRRSGWIVV